MDPQRWAKIESLYHAALEKGPGERAGYLAEACVDEPELRREVESLLSCADSDLNSPLATVGRWPSGFRLGSYEIIDVLGAGGMGEVYRARDTKLLREVAIKVLPPAFRNDASRLARFEREAHVLASLNHQRIGAIYGLEDFNGTRLLVLELVEGPTLAERLAAGSLSLAEALSMGIEIAEALEAAHDKGVIHRDLKPANIKLTSDGHVKVLDFGLAKAPSLSSAPDQVESFAANLPTLASAAGVILGTAAYMSPEQAQGKPLDKRTDVWSFAVVMYEILTGERAFDGESIPEIIEQVLEQEPDWSKLPPGTPSGMRDLLKRCLRKTPAQRPRDIGDLRLQMQDLSEKTETPTEAAARPKRTKGLLPALVAAALLAAVSIMLYLRQEPPPPRVTRLEIAQPADVSFSNLFTVSPDGRHLVFLGTGEGHSPQLWVRSLDSFEIRPLPGTEGAQDFPIWSPDSRYIVFWSDGKLRKIDASGGPIRVICDALGVLTGGFWTKDDKIIFGLNAAIDDGYEHQRGGLLQVDASGGTPTPVTVLAKGEFRHFFPVLLPDGRHFIYNRAGKARSGSSGMAGSGGIYVGSLDVRPEAQSLKPILSDFSRLAYAQTAERGADKGYLLLARGAELVAQPFDSKRLALDGEATPIVDQVAGNAFFSGSPSTVVYRAGPEGSQQTWYDRRGNPLGAVGDASLGSAPVLSPDGKRLAFTRTDPRTGNNNIWLYDFAHALSQPLTVGPGGDHMPIWSHHSSRIAFARQKESTTEFYEKDLNGNEELLFLPKSRGAPTSWSHDERFMLYETPAVTYKSEDIWVLSLSAPAAQREAWPFAVTQFNERDARFSPDDRFVSYTSDESGRDEIWVRRFNPSPKGASLGQEWQVSKGGGGAARWRGDGKELVYLAPDNSVMSVQITYSPAFQASVPQRLFKSAALGQFLEINSDATRFLMPVPAAGSSSTPYKVILNWAAMLR